MKSFMFVMLCVFHCAFANDFVYNLNRDEMIDPHDWNYDRVTKSLKSAQDKQESAGTCETLLKRCENEVVECKEKTVSLNEVSNKSQNVKVERNTMTSNGENIKFIRRFVNLLLKAASLSSETSRDGGLIDITLTSEQLSVLENFGGSNAQISIRELDNILSSAIQSSSLHGRNGSFTFMDKVLFFFSSREVWFLVAACGLVLLLFWLLFAGHTVAGIITIFLMLLFIASFVMEYYRMYKEAEIDQLIFLKQYSDIPESCRSSERTWYQALFNLFASSYQFNTDECKRYHYALMHDPIVQVSPSRVLSSLVSDFFLHPANKLGTAIAAFTTGLMGNLPPVYAWIVYILWIIIIFGILMLGIVMLCGGRVLFRGPLMGMELSGNNAPIQTEVKPSISPSAVAGPNQEKIADGSTHPLVAAVSTSKDNNLILMNAKCLKDLMTHGSLTQQSQDPLMQHRSPVETISSSNSQPQSTAASNSCGELQEITQSCKSSGTPCKVESVKSKPTINTEDLVKANPRGENIS